MTQEIISGLHSVKPGNEPVIGQVKTFIVEQKTGKTSGKPYLKIKSSAPEFGGQSYRILEATPTGFTDSYGNVSFNIGIERVNGLPPGGVLPSGAAATFEAAQDRSHRIERQHSQDMSLRAIGSGEGMAMQTY